MFYLKNIKTKKLKQGYKLKCLKKEIVLYWTMIVWNDCLTDNRYTPFVSKPVLKLLSANSFWVMWYGLYFGEGQITGVLSVMVIMEALISPKCEYHTVIICWTNISENSSLHGLLIKSLRLNIHCVISLFFIILLPSDFFPSFSFFPPPCSLEGTCCLFWPGLFSVPPAHSTQCLSALARRMPLIKWQQ